MEREVSKHFRAAISKGHYGQPKKQDGQVKEYDEKTTVEDNQLPYGRVVGSCLRVYSALNKASSAYEIYREIVVKPRVQQVCKWLRECLFIILLALYYYSNLRNRSLLLQTWKRVAEVHVKD